MSEHLIFHAIGVAKSEFYKLGTRENTLGLLSWVAALHIFGGIIMTENSKHWLFSGSHTSLSRRGGKEEIPTPGVGANWSGKIKFLKCHSGFRLLDYF